MNNNFVHLISLEDTDWPVRGLSFYLEDQYKGGDVFQCSESTIYKRLLEFHSFKHPLEGESPSIRSYFHNEINTHVDSVMNLIMAYTVSLWMASLYGFRLNVTSHLIEVQPNPALFISHQVEISYSWWKVKTQYTLPFIHFTLYEKLCWQNHSCVTYAI